MARGLLRWGFSKQNKINREGRMEKVKIVDKSELMTRAQFKKKVIRDIRSGRINLPIDRVDELIDLWLSPSNTGRTNYTSTILESGRVLLKSQ